MRPSNLNRRQTINVFVTRSSRNYALPIFAFVVIVVPVLWLDRPRKSWPGLNKKEIDVVLADSDCVSKDVGQDRKVLLRRETHVCSRLC